MVLENICQLDETVGDGVELTNPSTHGDKKKDVPAHSTDAHMGYIKLIEDVIFEQSEGTLMCLKKGSFGKLLEAGELNAILDGKPKDLVNSVLNEIEACLNVRPCPALFDGRLCLLREDEFTELRPSLPRIFAV